MTDPQTHASAVTAAFGPSELTPPRASGDAWMADATSEFAHIWSSVLGEYTNAEATPVAPDFAAATNVDDIREIDQTQDPIRLVPGSFDEVRTTAYSWKARSEAAHAVGDELARLADGASIDSHAREALVGQSTAWLRAATAVRAGASALFTWADSLEWAQDEAAQAVALWKNRRKRRQAWELLFNARKTLEVFAKECVAKLEEARDTAPAENARQHSHAPARSHAQTTPGGSTRYLLSQPGTVPEQLGSTLRGMNGAERTTYVIWPSENPVTAIVTPQNGGDSFMQAAGSADAMTIEVRILGSDGRWHLYTVGRQEPNNGETLLVPLNDTRQIRIFTNEAFTADEAVDIFSTYYLTNTVSQSYQLRQLDLSHDQSEQR